MVDTQIDRAATIAQSMAGSLTIGFTSGLACCGPLHAGIAEFHQSRPDVELHFVEGSPNDLHRQLNERSIDIMFTGLLPGLGGGPNVQERLWDDRLFVTLRDDHPLAGNDSLRWTDVSTLPVLISAHHGDLSYYRAIAARIGDLPFDCTSHDVSAGALMDLVALGLGATIVCTSGTVPHNGIIYRPIIEASASITAEAIWPKDDRNPLRHRLLICVRKHVSSNWTSGA